MTTRTHDSIRESRVIGAEPEHEPREKQTLLKPYMRMMGRAQLKNATAAAKAVEKTLREKVEKQTFPLRLEIPQTTRDSHFSHSLDYCWIFLAWWTYWLRPKPTKMAPFITGAERLPGIRADQSDRSPSCHHLRIVG